MYKFDLKTDLGMNHVRNLGTAYIIKVTMFSQLFLEVALCSNMALNQSFPIFWGWRLCCARQQSPRVRNLVNNLPKTFIFT